MNFITRLISIVSVLVLGWTQVVAQVTDAAARVTALKCDQIKAGSVIVCKGISATNTKWVNWAGASTNLPTPQAFLVVEAGSDATSFCLKRKFDNKYIGKNAGNITFVNDKAQATQFTLSAPKDNEMAQSGLDLTFPQGADKTYMVRFTVKGTGDFLNVQNEANTPKYASGKGAWSVAMVYDWNCPVEASTISGADFPADTKWFLLKLRDSYLKYNASVADQTLNVEGSGTTNYGDEFWWAFAGDEENGFKLYNKAAGVNKIFTSVSSATSGARAHMADASSLGSEKNELWTIYYSNNYSGDNGFYLSRKGETTKLNFQKNGPVYWSGADQGSTFRITSPLTAGKALIAPFEMTTAKKAVGSLTESALQKIKGALDGTITGLKNAKELVTTHKQDIITFDANKFYRLENLMRKFSTANGNNLHNGGYLEAVDHLEKPAYNAQLGFFSNDKNEARAQAIWKFEAAETNTYYLKNLNANVYIGGSRVNNQQISNGTANKAEASAFEIHSVGEAQHTLLVKNAGAPAGIRLHASGTGNDAAAIMYHDGGEINSASAWYLIPATNIQVTISEAGYATVNYPFAVQLPAGLKAYTGKANSAQKVLTLTAVEGDIVPANTPVVLEGTANTYELTILAENNAAALANNDFKGSSVFMDVEAAKNAYILGNGTSGVGFYKMSTADRKLGANKAYIELPAAQANVLSIIIGGQTTGIEDAVTETAEEVYFDLQGRRVQNPTKGIFVTKSGKKVLFY